MTRLLYFLRRAMAGMRQEALVTTLTVLTIAISLLVVTVFIGAVGGVRAVLQSWGDEQLITLYLEDGASSEVLTRAVEGARALAPEATLEHVSSEEALARLEASLGEQSEVLEGIGENPLPASIEVRLGQGIADPGTLAVLAEEMGRLPGVAEADFGQEWAERLDRLVSLAGMAAWLFGGLILFAAAVMVSNTIKLAVFARRDEIEIMKLCGATDAFVRAPFLIEGMLQGLAGAGVAVGAALGLWQLTVPALERGLRDAFAMHVQAPMPGTELLWLLVAGAGLGLVGAALSLGRFLKV